MSWAIIPLAVPGRETMTLGAAVAPSPVIACGCSGWPRPLPEGWPRDASGPFCYCQANGCHVALLELNASIFARQLQDLISLRRNP